MTTKPTALDVLAQLPDAFCCLDHISELYCELQGGEVDLSDVLRNAEHLRASINDAMRSADRLVARNVVGADHPHGHQYDPDR